MVDFGYRFVSQNILLIYQGNMHAKNEYPRDYLLHLLSIAPPIVDYSFAADYFAVFLLSFFPREIGFFFFYFFFIRLLILLYQYVLCQTLFIFWAYEVHNSSFCPLCSHYCLICTSYCLLFSSYCLLCSSYCLLCSSYCLVCSSYCLLCSS